MRLSRGVDRKVPRKPDAVVGGVSGTTRSFFLTGAGGSGGGLKKLDVCDCPGITDLKPLSARGERAERGLRS